MSKPVRSPLQGLVAITSADPKIWSADEESQSLAGFDPASGKFVQLDAKQRPVDGPLSSLR